VRNKPEKLSQLLVSSSLDESKDSATTKSANPATNTDYRIPKLENLLPSYFIDELSDPENTCPAMTGQ
jgi:hypothetical protein